MTSFPRWPPFVIYSILAFFLYFQHISVAHHLYNFLRCGTRICHQNSNPTSCEANKVIWRSFEGHSIQFLVDSPYGYHCDTSFTISMCWCKFSIHIMIPVDQKKIRCMCSERCVTYPSWLRKINSIITPVYSQTYLQTYARSGRLKRIVSAWVGLDAVFRADSKYQI